MFGNNDKITLTLYNAMGKNGKLLPFVLSLPVGDEDIEIPENVLQMRVDEYNQGSQDCPAVAFYIYVGKVSTVASLFNGNKKLEISKNIDSIESIDMPICYYTSDDDRNIIFAKVNDNDIVVEDTEELKKVITIISNHFAKVKDEVSKVKELSLMNKQTCETK